MEIIWDDEKKSTRANMGGVKWDDGTSSGGSTENVAPVSGVGIRIDTSSNDPIFDYGNLPEGEKFTASDAIKDPAKLAVGAIAFPAYLANKAARGLTATGEGIYEGLKTGSFDEGLAAATNRLNKWGDIPLPAPKLAELAGKYYISPMVGDLGELTGQPELVNTVVEAAGDLAPIKGMKASMPHIGTVAANVRNSAPKWGVKDAAKETASEVADKTGLSQLAERYAEVRAPKTEVEALQRAEPYLRKLSRPPKKMEGMINRETGVNAYLGNNFKAMNENINQRLRADPEFNPKDYAKDIDLTKEVLATDNTRANLFKEYNELLTDHPVPMNDMVEFYVKQLENPLTDKHGLRDRIIKRIDYYKKHDNQPLSQIQAEIADFNSNLDTRLLSSSEHSFAKLEALENLLLRKKIDDAINTLPDTPSYQELKTLYGASKQHGSDMANMLNNYATTEARRVGSWLDTIAALEGVHGVMAMSPEMVVGAVTAKTLANTKKALKDPNRALRKAYEIRADQFKPRKKAELAEPVTPPEASASASPVPAVPVTPPAAPKPKKRSQSISADKFAEQFGISVEEAARILEEGTKGIPKMAEGGLVGLASKYKL